MKRLVQCAAIAAMVSVAAPAAAEDVLELEGAVVGNTAGMGPAFRLGFVLTDRVTIGIGIAASGSVGERRIGGLSTGGIGGLGYGALGSEGWFSLSVPIDLKLWLLPARPGGVSPTVRIVGTYAYSGLGNVQASSALGASLLVGASYMIDETIGVSMEAGARYMRSWHELPGASFSFSGVDLGYRASLLLRI